MHPDTATLPATSPESGAPEVVKHRDAVKTRRLLLESARRRFAVDGYAATTVRDIANDAGVNVALINRYFTSKEGLFEACLERAVDELDRPDVDGITFESLVERLVEQIATPDGGQNPLQLLLLLRSSGDEHADRIRRQTIQSYAERLAAVTGWTPDRGDRDRVLLRAQIAIATALGIVLLRSSARVEPLTSATAEQFTEPIGDVLRALLPHPAARR